MKSGSGIVLKMEWITNVSERQVAYVGWAGGCSSESQCIEIDASFAKVLQLTESSRVNVTLVNHMTTTNDSVSVANAVSVEPASTDDWEILELHSDYLEHQILNQIRIVYRNQPFTVWIRNQTCISLRIVAIEAEINSDACFCLAADASEIIVAPKTRGSKAIASDASNPTVESAVMRYIPQSVWITQSGSFQQSSINAFGVSIPSDALDTFPVGSVAKLEHLEFDKCFVMDSSQQEVSKSLSYIFVRISGSHGLKRHLVMQDGLASSQNLRPFSMLRLTCAESFKTVGQPIVQLSLLSRTSLGLDYSQLFTVWAENAAFDDGRVLLFDGMFVRLVDSESPIHCRINLISDTDSSSSSESPKMVLMTTCEVSKLRVTAKLNDSGLDVSPESVSQKQSVLCESVIKALVDDACKYFRRYRIALSVFKFKQPRNCGLIIQGPSGSGRSTLAGLVCNKWSQNSLSYQAIVKCSRWKGLPIHKVAYEWLALKTECLFHLPSIIVLDDLDDILPVDTERSDSTQSKRFAHLFIDVFCTQICPGIVVVATSRDGLKGLHPLISEKGVFGHTITIKSPCKNERITLLRHFLNQVDNSRNSHGIEIEEVAGRMDGYVVEDIKNVFERSVQRCIVRQLKRNKSPIASCKPVLVTADFDSALDGFKPASLRSVQLHTSNVTWSSIGGMEETKAVLLQTLKWPTLYPELFAQAPLRLRSGILLFGFTGCGKTMLASAVAHECGLNFISVKGPELLNKYIGASEQSVRDLFERAQAAKPCCLFFDEFEAIAPRRGHDNTGVTDRVVNQLLTQMDGAEGLEGVFVLAATSRPDLIDPALLRPGRLDKSILCDIPTFDDRVKIMHAVSQKIYLSANVSLESIATQTDGFTGADLQGLLYTAHLAAIKETLETQTPHESRYTNRESRVPHVVTNTKEVTKNEMRELRHELQRIEQAYAKSNEAAEECINKEEKAVVYVEQRHIEDALKHCKASVSLKERRKLENVYRQFINGDVRVDVGSRSSLA